MSRVKTLVTRYHDFSYGHRILGDGPCRSLHGHNARATFYLEGSKDRSGHIIEFSEIKLRLVRWIETYWDHKLLLYKDDPVIEWLRAAATLDTALGRDSWVQLGFHPTAENLAQFLIEVVCPQQLEGTGCVVTRIDFLETRKCGVTVTI